MSCIIADKLCVKYRGQQVLTDVDFTIAEGDYIGIVGPNGSGKTTLIRTLLGLIEPASGQITINGATPKAFRNWRNIGYLAQKNACLYPHFPASVFEVVASGLLSLKSFPRRITSADTATIDAMLEQLNIADLKHELIGCLSGGQQQRVLLARALVHQPDILILDEPTVALDPQARRHFYGLLEQLNRERRITIVLVTHDMGTIGEYAAKLMYVDRRLVFFGPFDAFCHSPEMTELFGKDAQHIICHQHHQGGTS